MGGFYEGVTDPHELRGGYTLFYTVLSRTRVHILHEGYGSHSPNKDWIGSHYPTLVRERHTRSLCPSSLPRIGGSLLCPRVTERGDVQGAVRAPTTLGVASAPPPREPLSSLEEKVSEDREETGQTGKGGRCRVPSPRSFGLVTTTPGQSRTE